jgi:hypothetical protein
MHRISTQPNASSRPNLRVPARADNDVRMMPVEFGLGDPQGLAEALVA